MRENNLEEMEVLTKRFKDYIDKVQVTLDKVDPSAPQEDIPQGDASDKFYTVVSPVDVMTNNMKSVLNVLEEAILTIEKISNTAAEDLLSVAEATVMQGEKKRPEPAIAKKILLKEELDFLEKTFTKIIKASAKERNRIFEDLDKITES